ncbi:hypothetical protein TRIP_E190132 [uncultured Spirochaetota bacterium]|uniref:Uncharacterized protein n=1 Tax=uncultured Spirochaetota bacterium TaxID=460511 RepID=A0A652ZTV9_9SPIR|nr:hypothetical protein TRIP_E190132 [uncultured Spirochaetota bacterium]
MKRKERAADFPRPGRIAGRGAGWGAIYCQVFVIESFTTRKRILLDSQFYRSAGFADIRFDVRRKAAGEGFDRGKEIVRREPEL